MTAETSTGSEMTINTGRDLEIEGSVVGGDQVGRDKLAAGRDITTVAGDKYEVAQIIQHYYAVTEPEVQDEAPAPGEPPYKGRQYFDVVDADLFFGREAAVAAAVGHLRTHNLLAVVGASAVGKSSLVRAGILPALRHREPLADKSFPPDGSSAWPVHIIRPSANPLRALAVSLTRYETSVATASSLEKDLAADAGSLSFIVQRIVDRSQGAQRLLLVIDQFEELFTLCTDGALAAQFVANLVAALQEAPLTLIFTLRSHAYAACRRFPTFWELLQNNHQRLAPMHAEGLRAVIEQPAAAHDWSVEPIAANLLLFDAQTEPAALTLLSEALLASWHARRGRELRLPSYIESGRVQPRIVAQADAFYRTALDAHQKILAERIFLRLVELGEGSQDKRRAARLEEFLVDEAEQAEIMALLRRLADARLVVIDDPALDAEQAVVVEMAHAALISDWPLLASLLGENREALRLQRLLATQTRRWLSGGRDENDLYRGARLLDMEAQAGRWQSQAALQLNRWELEFLRASRAAEDAAAALEQQRREQKLRDAQAKAAAEAEAAAVNRLRAEESERAAARLRKFLITLAAVLGITLLTLLYGLYQTGRSNFALARQLESEVRTAFYQQNYHLAALLALEEQKVAQETGVLRRALQGILYEGAIWRALSDQGDPRQQNENQVLLQRLPYLFEYTAATPLTAHEDPVNAVAWDPTGRYLASGSDTLGDEVLVWDTQARDTDDGVVTRVAATLSEHDGAVQAVAWSPTGEFLATASTDWTVIIWETATWEPVATLEEHADWVRAVAWSPEHTRLASAADDGSVIVWDTATWEAVATLEGHGSWVRAVAWQPGGELLASAADDGSVIVWDIERGTALYRLNADAAVYTLAWHPDELLLALGDSGGQIALWPPASNETQAVHDQHTGPVWAVAWHPDGQRLVSGGADGNVFIWNRDSGDSRVLQGHGAEVNGVAWHPDGRQLATGSSDTEIFVWDTQNIQKARAFAGHQAGIEALAWRATGDRLATGDAEGGIIVWDHAVGQSSLEPVGEWRGHTAGINALAWHPTEERLASGADDAQIIVWLPEGQITRRLEAHTGSVNSVAWHPTNGRLASGADDDLVIVWSPEGQPELRLQAHTGNVNSVAWHPTNGRLASGGNDDQIIIWSPAGREELRLQGHTGDVNSLAWHPDPERNWLASGSDDRTVVIWDVDTAAAVHTLSHAQAVNAVWWVPDATLTTLAVALEDGRTAVWRLAAGEASEAEAWERVDLLGHVGTVNGAAWSPPYGSGLATVGSDQLVRLLPERFTRPPCEWLVRNLTRAEWELYRSGTAYAKTCPNLPEEPRNFDWLFNLIAFAIVLGGPLLGVYLAWRLVRRVWGWLVRVPVIGPVLESGARLVSKLVGWIFFPLRWLLSTVWGLVGRVGRWFAYIPWVQRLRMRLAAWWTQLLHPTLPRDVS